MSRELLLEEKYILDLLKVSVSNTASFDKREFIKAGIDVDRVIEISQAHMITALMYTALERAYLPVKLIGKIEDEAKNVVSKNYRLLFLSRAIQKALENHGIENAVIKGSATASLYDVPEYRKSGDVDILILDDKKLDEACDVIKELGLDCNDVQRALHHVAFSMEEGIDVELHSMLAEPFDNKEINDYLFALTKECTLEKISIFEMEITALTTAYNAFELLLHMLQHFLRAGFGLKLLCDWVVFWNRDIEENEKEKYLKLVTESKIKGFSDIVTKTCIEYLGLNPQKVSFMELENIDISNFIVDIFDAEEFGHSSNDRMVGMRGASLSDFVREFHHQTCLNYPKASKMIITFPVLWVCTLTKFMINNRRIRNVSVGEVLKSARTRGQLINELHLFE